MIFKLGNKVRCIKDCETIYGHFISVGETFKVAGVKDNAIAFSGKKGYVNFTNFELVEDTIPYDKEFFDNDDLELVKEETQYGVLMKKMDKCRRLNKISGVLFDIFKYSTEWHLSAKEDKEVVEDILEYLDKKASEIVKL